MSFSCAICCSSFQPSNEIFNSRCGHVFHFQCLSRWLKRSNTCPQCRKQTSSTEIHRLYLNISNDNSKHDDPVALQKRIKNLKFWISNRETHSKNVEENLKNQMDELRESLSNFKNVIKHQNSTIHELKKQVKDYKKLEYKQEVESLKMELNNLQMSFEKMVRSEDRNSTLKKPGKYSEELQNKNGANSSKISNLNPLVNKLVGNVPLVNKSVGNVPLVNKSNDKNKENSLNSQNKINLSISGDKRKLKFLNSGNITNDSNLAKKPRLNPDLSSPTKRHNGNYLVSNRLRVFFKKREV